VTIPDTLLVVQKTMLQLVGLCQSLGLSAVRLDVIVQVLEATQKKGGCDPIYRRRTADGGLISPVCGSVVFIVQAGCLQRGKDGYFITESGRAFLETMPAVTAEVRGLAKEIVRASAVVARATTDHRPKSASS